MEASNVRPNLNVFRFDYHFRRRLFTDSSVVNILFQTPLCYKILPLGNSSLSTQNDQPHRTRRTMNLIPQYLIKRNADFLDGFAFLSHCSGGTYSNGEGPPFFIQGRG